MKITLAATLRHYDKKNFIKDLLAGIIIMAVSIPISMGYAQIAGLPAVYGLYGSVFPIRQLQRQSRKIKMDGWPATDRRMHRKRSLVHPE